MRSEHQSRCDFTTRRCDLSQGPSRQGYQRPIVILSSRILVIVYTLLRITKYMCYIHLLDMAGGLFWGWKFGIGRSHMFMKIVGSFIHCFHSDLGLSKSNIEFSVSRYFYCKGWQEKANILCESPPYCLDLPKSI